MLKEYDNLRQDETGFRRLFFDEYFDLYAWYDREGGRITGFQLVYDKLGLQRSLTWLEDEGFLHNKVDEGERAGSIKMTPILVPDGAFDADTVAERFARESGNIDPGFRTLVLGKLAAFKAEESERFP